MAGCAEGSRARSKATRGHSSGLLEEGRCCALGGEVTFKTSIYALQGAADFPGDVPWIRNVLTSRCEECGVCHEESYWGGQEVTEAYRRVHLWETTHHCVEIGVAG